MHRVYIAELTTQSSTITITNPSEIHHLKNVLRLRKNTGVQLFNGQGLQADGTISEIAPQKVEISLINFVHSSEKTIHITLACAIPKKAKFETIIEKCTELGVDAIIPMITKRTNVKLDDQRKSRKSSRFETVAVNAAKQSKRTTLPVIYPILTLPDALKHIDTQTCALIPWLEGNRKSLHTILREATTAKQKFFILIGPEGDFTPGEVELAQRHGCIPVSLGSTVLKVDTAAISTIAFLQLYLSK